MIRKPELTKGIIIGSVGGAADEENALLEAGYRIYELPHGQHAIADPHDNADGFYLVLSDRDKLIHEAHASIFRK